jgi:hypothetical protein
VPRLALTLINLAIVLAACGPGTALPSAEPSQAPASPSLAPSDSPPSPSIQPPAPTPGTSDSPPPVLLTAGERYLIDGIRRGAIDCKPVRDALPGKALAGIECRSNDPSVARIGFSLFASDADMLEHYFHRLRLEGVKPDSGGCYDGEGEGPYIPETGTAPDRRGCFVNDEGYANLRATMSGNHVYIGVLGRTANTRALDDFAWRGSVDVPSMPTLWTDPGN